MSPPFRPVIELISFVKFPTAPVSTESLYTPVGAGVVDIVEGCVDVAMLLFFEMMNPLCRVVEPPVFDKLPVNVVASAVMATVGAITPEVTFIRGPWPIPPVFTVYDFM